MFSEKMATGIGYQLLELAGGELPHKKFMKLLYLVEREWLRFAGVTMTGDRLKNMNDGPMLSLTYNCMKAGLKRQGAWSEHLSQIDNRTVKIVAPSDSPSVLSRRQLRIVQEVWEKYGGMEEDDLIALTHDLPEWHFPNGGSVDISLEEVFCDFGCKEDEAAEMVNRLRDREQVQAAFGSVA